MLRSKPSKNVPTYTNNCSYKNFNTFLTSKFLSILIFVGLLFFNIFLTFLY